MNIKEYLEKIFVACTFYDKEITGKLGTEGEYEGSYEQAYDMLLKELDKKDKVIKEAIRYIEACKTALGNYVLSPSETEYLIKILKQVEVEDE